MLKKLFAPGVNTFGTNLALLVFRVWLGGTMLLNHGWAKLTGFSSMAGSFPDPFGVGHTASMAMVVFAEVVASALLAIGLVTRFAALVVAINMAVAFFYAHKGALSGEHSGELAFIYLAGCVALIISGGGAFSLDKLVFKSKGV
jgi:putative oxidoreductase